MDISHMVLAYLKSKSGFQVCLKHRPLPTDFATIHKFELAEAESRRAFYNSASSQSTHRRGGSQTRPLRRLSKLNHANHRSNIAIHAPCSALEQISTSRNRTPRNPRTAII